MATMNTYISKDRRQDLIEQYLDCWWDTCSYSTEAEAETEALLIRTELEAMNNSQLVAEIEATGWGIV